MIPWHFSSRPAPGRHKTEPGRNRPGGSTLLKAYPMTARWKIKATTIEGGFLLHLSGGKGNLGHALLEALGEADAVAVEMEDGGVLELLEAVVSLLKHRVPEGVVVLTDPVRCRHTRRFRSLVRRVEHRHGNA